MNSNAAADFLVTGGAGFIGSHLVERLIRDGHRVRVLDDLSSGKLENLHAVKDRLDFVHGNAALAADTARAVAGVRGVFHLAAISSVTVSIEQPLRNQQAGEVATLTVLDAARRAGVRRVVLSSSASVYGNSENAANAESLPSQPLSFYALSKLTGENYARIFSALHPGFDTVSLRYFNVFGPRQDPANPYSGVISIFLRCLKTGHAPTIFGDGRQTRDFVEVSNIVEANLLAMQAAQPLRGEVYNVGTGESVSLLEVWQRLGELAGTSLQPAFAAPRAGDIRHSRAAIEKIRAQLGYAVRVSWQDGLQKLWDSLK